MYQCPKCGRTMNWYMCYNFGIPWSGWKCECGYDTNHWSNTITTNRTIGRLEQFRVGLEQTERSE